jgi:HK97 family phage portal protein
MLNRLSENRALSFQSVWGAGGDFQMENSAGVVINNKTAFEIVAFFSAISLISDTISTLPVDSFIRYNGNRVAFRPKPAWVDQPDINQTRSAFWQQNLVSLMTAGNAFTRVFRDNNGDVVNLTVLDPASVEVKHGANSQKLFIYKGEKNALTSQDIIHLTDLLEPGQLRGISRVEKLSDALGVASALQSYAAKFFGSGASTAGVIETPGTLNAAQAKDLAESYDRAHRGWRNSFKTGVLSGGATYKQTSVPNDSAQFLESRRFAVEEIARLFNIPLNMMGIPGTQSYASVEQNNISFVVHTLRPYIEKIEWAFSKLLPNNAFIKFNVDGLLRGDFQTRLQGYSIGMQSGFLSINDIHRLEDMAPVEGGDVYRVSLANVDLKAAEITGDAKKVQMASQLINAGFDPASVLDSLGLPAITHTGVPSVQLQQVATIDPNDPAAVYGVN